MSFSFQILTYGCKVNQYESQSVREYWQGLGAREIFEKDEIPDLILLSGCAVTAQGVADARQMALSQVVPPVRNRRTFVLKMCLPA